MNKTLIEQHGFDLIEQVDDSSRTVVWKALQRSLERTVILRILKPEAAANPAEVDHFLTIARRIARIKSDAIASIFDIVSHGDLHYIVMEHVEGPSLEELVSAHGPLPQDQILRIISSLIGSVSHMWDSAHIVHRNLKSATIRLDSRGIAKIMDFGLAIIAGPNVDATAMDGGHIVGTPCFLSPEQAQGANTLNTQSDMYALGAVCYHLATGIVPFEGQDVVSILTAHIKHQIPPPHRLNPALSPSFSWLVHRLMMKNPSNRYACWEDVLKDIRCLLEGTPPSCIHPEEQFLSTIETFHEPDATAAEASEQTAPRIRLNVKEKDTRIASYQSKTIIDEHVRETRKATFLREALLWCILAVWLTLLFLLRAVYPVYASRSDNTLDLTAFTEAASQLSSAITPPQRVADAPEPPPAEAPLPADAPKPADPVTAAVQPPSPPPPVAPPKKEPEQPPSGIPPRLANALAQALASGDTVSATFAVRDSSEPFKEKDALLALLEKTPEPDALVAAYLNGQIGRPLILEHRGRQRTVIPRGIEGGVLQIESNGRGAELPIDRLLPDEKLRWMNKPSSAEESLAYCLTLMHSSRRTEVPFYAKGCPLLTQVLIDAAKLVPEQDAPTAVE